jgi:hypothetical protein
MAYGVFCPLDSVQSRVMIHGLDMDFKEENVKSSALDFLTKYLLDLSRETTSPSPFIYLGGQTPFLRIPRFHPRAAPIQKLQKMMEDRINEKLASNTELMGKGGVNMDDLRIREFVEDETKPVRFWMAMGQELAHVKALREVNCPVLFR